MKWGIRRYQPYPKGGKKGKFLGNAKAAANKAKTKTVQSAYALGAKVNPRELNYTVKRALTKTKDVDRAMVKLVDGHINKTGVLPNDETVVKSIDRKGIQYHKEAKYDNLDKSDIGKLKKYTDAAVYSRAVNTYLATGEPSHIADQANDLRDTVQKNSISGIKVYRSTNLKFSTDGIVKKLETHGEDALKESFNDFDKNFKGKSFKENRIYSTSTSPSFAIDTWRKVNPTAAKTYNAYMVIDTNNTPGLLADGRTGDGGKIVNTRSNQEGILAPNKMTYKKLAWDSSREMFAIHLEAE